MLELVVAGEGREQEKLASMRSRAAQTGAEIQRGVGAIREEVRAGGYEGVEEYSVKLDRTPPREVSMEELEQAAGRIAPPRRFFARSRICAARRAFFPRQDFQISARDFSKARKIL